MASKQRILIVDDDENIAELISLYLTKECYETKIVYDGESALSELSVFKPNLILLDLMLPGIDGYQVCREIRKNNNVPIIMLSAKGETFDKVLGLELGADDYIIKPFETKEMVARVKAVLRRYHMPQSIGVDSSNAKCVNYPDLSINLDNYSVNYMGKNVEMPPKELELLYFFAAPASAPERAGPSGAAGRTLFLSHSHFPCSPDRIAQNPCSRPVHRWLHRPVPAFPAIAADRNRRHPP